MNFETWFHQVELYGLKSERFYDIVKLHQNNPVYAESLVAWLRAAYQEGQNMQSIERERVDETAKQRHEWVGLTDQEFQWIYDNGRTPAGMIEMAEAKLKEKNNG